jgi:DNA-binding transcriptional MerR regulator
MPPYKVGELARRTGLSVRTLHYYDEIGLLEPAKLTGSGHRVYGTAELARLQQIKSLRQLGFTLEQIRECLDTPAFSPRRVLGLHVARLRQQIIEQERLAALLETLAASFDSGQLASPEEFLCAIEGISLIERAFTPEELSEIRTRGAAYGAAHIRAVEKEWPQLIAKVRRHFNSGTSPASRVMRPLAMRWRELVRQFTGGNPRIEQKLRAMYVSEPRLMKQNGLDPALLAYVNKAIRALDTDAT